MSPQARSRAFSTRYGDIWATCCYTAANRRVVSRTGRGSVMPVWGFMDDFPADHGHCSRDVAQPGLIDGERIGAQDGEVREFAGLQRALLAFVEGEIGAACSRAAQ